MLYWMVNESTSAFDRVSKETENFGYFEHRKVSGFITVRAPGQPYSTRGTAEQAPGPEHEIEAIFGVEQLERARITPKPKDLLRASGVYYVVQFIQKAEFVENSPFNVNVVLKVKRVEKVPDNLDLPFDDEPELAPIL